MERLALRGRHLRKALIVASSWLPTDLVLGWHLIAPFPDGHVVGQKEAMPSRAGGNQFGIAFMSGLRTRYPMQSGNHISETGLPCDSKSTKSIRQAKHLAEMVHCDRLSYV